MSWLPHIQPTDDRGSVVTLHPFNLPRKAPRRLRKLSGGISLFDSKNIHWTVVLAFISVWALPIVVLTIIDQRVPDSSLPDWAFHVAMGGTALAIVCSWKLVPFIAKSRQRELNRRAIEAWSKAGLCPACGHDLALDVHNGETKPDPNGIAACPKCRAQWQAARFGPAIDAHAGDWRRKWQESQQSRQTDAAS